MNIAVATFGAYTTYHWLLSHKLGEGTPALLILSSLAYFVLNTTGVAGVVALTERKSVIATWRNCYFWSFPFYLVGASIAWVFSVLTEHGHTQSILLLLPVIFVIYRSYRMYFVHLEGEKKHVEEMASLHLRTIEALALAIDAKDQTAQSHIRRVQVYAAGIASSLGMPETEIQGVKTAALLHDIGKLAVPEHILSKPGPLTQEEFQKVRIHPQVGAEIISGVPFPYPVAPLILSHHERWDGKGYPAGLAGDEIPLGARILSVVDYFDALMSERPYHKAMSLDAAIGLLRQESGKALDPRVVQMFIEMYPTLAAEAEATQDPPRKLTRVAAHAPEAQPAVGFESDTPAVRTNVFEDIALAHREIYALYEIAQAMGSSLGVSDTMALISSKLSNIVPFSCCALYLYTEETDTLRCRFATGVECEVVQQMTIASGHGLTGWVARNRRPLVNARPSADFEAAGLSQHTALQSALVCPLVFNERFIGTIAVYHTAPSVYTDDHRRLLDRISEQAAAVIYNSIVFEQTQEDSLTDPLTTLPNTRFMFMHLTRELARASRLKSEVSLLVMDLDSFKEINDTYGHHVGDRALREVRIHRGAFGMRRRGSGAQARRTAARRGRTPFRAPPRDDARPRDQHRRRGVSARWRVVRDASGDGRQPDVPRQGAQEADPRRPARRTAGRANNVRANRERRTGGGRWNLIGGSLDPVRAAPGDSRPDQREPRRANHEARTLHPPWNVARQHLDACGGHGEREADGNRQTAAAYEPQHHAPGASHHRHTLIPLAGILRGLARTIPHVPIAIA
jgi:putative nucleotidyltransferase with HDIG domain